jgi:hypothetical protein
VKACKQVSLASALVGPSDRMSFAIEVLAELCKYPNEELVLICTSTVDVYKIEIIPVRESGDVLTL